MNMNRSRLCFFLLLFSMAALMAESCQNNKTIKNGQQEIVVTVDANGKAMGGHRFTKIDNSNFYIDDIKYTAQNGDLFVSGYDEGFFKGEAIIISQLNYDGRLMRVISIGEKAFFDCKVLTSIVIPSCVTSIGNNAFSNCENLSSVAIPNTVTSIGELAFSSCKSLTSIAIPDHLTKIENGAFSACGITIAKIPKGVTHIGFNAFGICTSLKYVTIPETVTNIEGCAFMGCTSLFSVKAKMKTPVEIGVMTFTDCQKNATLYVPLGSKELYEYAEYWKEFKEIIEE